MLSRQNTLSVVSGIQKLVLAGRMGEAIETTQRLYPGLLEHNTNLLFMLKCRQFIEIVNGTDSEVLRGSGSTGFRSPRSRSSSTRSSPSMSPVHHGSSRAAPVTVPTSGTSNSNSPAHIITPSPSKGTSNQNSTAANVPARLTDLHTISEEEMNSANLAMNGSTPHTVIMTGTANHGNRINLDQDIDMDTSDSSETRTIANGSVSHRVAMKGMESSSGEDDMGKYYCDNIHSGPSLKGHSCQRTPL